MPKRGEELSHVIMNQGCSFLHFDSSSHVFNPLVSESEVDQSPLIFTERPGHQPVPRRTGEKQRTAPVPGPQVTWT